MHFIDVVTWKIRIIAHVYICDWYDKGQKIATKLASHLIMFSNKKEKKELLLHSVNNNINNNNGLHCLICLKYYS